MGRFSERTKFSAINRDQLPMAHLTEELNSFCVVAEEAIFCCVYYWLLSYSSWFELCV